MDCRHHSLFPNPLSRSTLISAVVALALLASACGSDSDAAAPASTATDSADTTLAGASGDDVSDDDVSSDTDSDTTDPTASEDAGADETGDPSTFFPDVLDATATRADDGTWTFAVTLSSPYDSPAQYADAWRVVGPDGTELGFRLLTHDHASEQPFTRSESGIVIPDGVTVVTIEGRDQANGWGGDFLELELPA